MKAPTSIEYAMGEPMPGTKWVVRGKLGQGGMGIVLDVEKGRLIRGAMKVLLPSFAKQQEFAARFLEKIKVTARLQHPSIVQVLDFDQLSDGTRFMVMERLRGRTLRAALRETRQRGTQWTTLPSPAPDAASRSPPRRGLARQKNDAVVLGSSRLRGGWPRGPPVTRRGPHLRWLSRALDPVHGSSTDSRGRYETHLAF